MSSAFPVDENVVRVSEQDQTVADFEFRVARLKVQYDSLSKQFASLFKKRSQVKRDLDTARFKVAKARAAYTQARKTLVEKMLPKQTSWSSEVTSETAIKMLKGQKQALAEELTKLQKSVTGLQESLTKSKNTDRTEVQPTSALSKTAEAKFQRTNRILERMKCSWLCLPKERR
ncbi:uncharacterized protein LOC135377342 [Ornithodoros turicata]|uniref:uncharacterized protein LOC135377342 n=1 Tax=Ornithodoros turicata TaxID=34597 RepID=UPI0031398719